VIGQSLKQRAHNIGYILNLPVSVPFCPDCHSYPCACDDNIIEEDNWPTLRYDDPGMSFDRFK